MESDVLGSGEIKRSEGEGVNRAGKTEEDFIGGGRGGTGFVDDIFNLFDDIGSNFLRTVGNGSVTLGKNWGRRKNKENNNCHREE